MKITITSKWSIEDMLKTFQKDDLLKRIEEAAFNVEKSLNVVNWQGAVVYTVRIKE